MYRHAARIYRHASQVAARMYRHVAARDAQSGRVLRYAAVIADDFLVTRVHRAYTERVRGGFEVAGLTGAG
jgi:hypothetical protein